MYLPNNDVVAHLALKTIRSRHRDNVSDPRSSWILLRVLYTLIGFCRPCQCPTSTQTLCRVSAKFRAGERDLSVIDNKKSWSLRADDLGGSLYTIRLKSTCMEPDLSLSEPRGLGPSSPVENGNSLACLLQYSTIPRNGNRHF